MNERRTPRRRERTRWLQLTALGGLAVIVTGVVLLESTAPQVDPSDLAVEGVPAPAVEEEQACTRQAEDAFVDDLREQFPPGGRVTSTQVYLCPRAFDQLEVTYVGEVVGDVLPRREGAWARVNDDAYALEVGPVVGHREHAGFNTGLPVWLPDGLHEQVEEVGRPGRRGDVILVRGTLLRADPDDGGSITIRADELEVLAPSVEVAEPLHRVQAVVAGVMVLLAAASLVWRQQARRR